MPAERRGKERKLTVDGDLASVEHFAGEPGSAAIGEAVLDEYVRVGLQEGILPARGEISYRPTRKRGDQHLARTEAESVAGSTRVTDMEYL